MPLPTSIHLYDLEKQILDTAISAGGANLKFPSYAAAVKWRARAYKFRKLYQNLQQERGADLAGYVASTPYDLLMMSIENEPWHRRNPNAECSVKIGPRPVPGVLTTLDGAPLDLTKPVEPDNLDSLRDQLSKDLDLDLG